MVGSVPQFRIVGRSYLLFVLVPEPPIAEWLVKLDAWMQRSPGFFEGRAVVLDLNRQALGKPGLSALFKELKDRNIAVIAVEGVDLSFVDEGLPPLLTCGRPADQPEHGEVDAQEEPTPGDSELSSEPTSLVLDKPVRSGQSIVFKNGDVTILGSIASGAEVVAGGSIHVYGALRGRALAGVSGNKNARIFCQNFNAELVAIDGFYSTINDTASQLCGRAVQAWLDRESLQMSALD